MPGIEDGGAVTEDRGGTTENRGGVTEDRVLFFYSRLFFPQRRSILVAIPDEFF